jgi:hypothetical protein
MTVMISAEKAEDGRKIDARKACSPGEDEAFRGVIVPETA